MKRQFLLTRLLLLFALVAGSGSNAWAEDITYTLTITTSDVNSINSGSGYAAYNGDRTTKAICTTDANNKMDVDWTSNQVMLQSSKIQFQKNAGYIYNSTNLGTITNVAITTSSGNTGTFSTWYGKSSHPTSGASGSGKGFFTIKETGNKTGTIDQIVITFKFTIPTITFNNGNVTEEETLDLRTLFSSNSEGDVTYSITSGDSFGQIESDGYTFTALAEGSVTVKASQAAKGIYAAKEQSATITVVSATSPSVVITPTTLSFGDVEVGKTKDLTFNITPANLTGDLTIASNNGKYTISPASISQATTTTQTITVTAAPTAANDNMDGTITISGGGITNQYVTLSATPYIASTVSLVADPVGKGTFTYNEATVTSINSKIGASVTVTAVPADGYLFNGWTATGATPASSNTEETEFTLTETEVTLTAIFIVDPRKYTTLDDKTIPAPAENVSYGTKQTFVKDGLTWETDGFQPQGLAVIQLRTNGSPYLKVPDFSGNIQTITMSVTDASNNATSKNATTTTATLSFAATKDGSAVKSAGGTATNTIVIDLSKEEENYSTGYITSSGGARIWDITVTYIPTDINVSISSAKYATFSDHLARNFSGKGITVYTAKSDGTKVNLTEVVDGIVPANKGVVLYSASVLNNIAIPVATTDPSNYNDEYNELVGINVRTLVAKTASTKTNYILSNETSGVGFYLAADDGGAYLPAHRAYLSTGAAASRSFLGFDDETTGIESIDVSTEDTNVAREYYNLNGQRVTTPTKGLYIVNGKKVIINK